jgi:hypothetical protein
MSATVSVVFASVMCAVISTQLDVQESAEVRRSGVPTKFASQAACTRLYGRGRKLTHIQGQRPLRERCSALRHTRRRQSSRDEVVLSPSPSNSPKRTSRIARADQHRERLLHRLARMNSFSPAGGSSDLLPSVHAGSGVRMTTKHDSGERVELIARACRPGRLVKSAPAGQVCAVYCCVVAPGVATRLWRRPAIHGELFIVMTSLDHPGKETRPCTGRLATTCSPPGGENATTPRRRHGHQDARYHRETIVGRL